ncbi:MAG: B12-binding domain-containing radical SAM protein [Alphaproteobacteria bacterium]|nr:B12-binding domain-containing radical SAM protein [Alphaproteobacteria bacterium]
MRILLIFKDSIAVERLAISQLSAVLKSAGHEVRLAILGPTPAKDFAQIISSFAPQVIGYSAMTGEHVALAELNRDLKRQFSFISVFGGPHSIFRHDFLEDENIDALCIGEGDTTFVELCRRLEAGEPWWETPTFHVRHRGVIYRNALAPLVDPAELPFPDRRIIYDADPNLARSGIKYFMAGRGCPYHCAYCFNARFNEDHKGLGKVLRARTAKQVVDEIAWVKEHYRLETVAFVDDVFNQKPLGWIDEFRDLYKQKIGLPFFAAMRANAIREVDIAALADAGLTLVWMGIESGNEKAANEILQRNLSNEQVMKAARILKLHGVKLTTQNLIGLPVSNPFEIDLETLDLNIAIRPTYGWSSILYPYPGTPIEAYARNNGYLSGELEYTETNKRSSMLDFKDAGEKRRVENLHKLFGLIVEFPFLRPFTRFLCDLPLTGFYRALFWGWYGFSVKFRLTKSRAIWRELPYLLNVFWRMVAKG